MIDSVADELAAVEIVVARVSDFDRAAATVAVAETLVADGTVRLIAPDVVAAVEMAAAMFLMSDSVTDVVAVVVAEPAIGLVSNA